MATGRSGGLNQRIRVASIGVILAVALGAAFYVRAGSAPTRIPDGMRVGTLDLGGLEETQAAERLRPYMLEQAARNWTLRWQDRAWTVTPQEAGFHYNLQEVLDQALAAGRSQPWWRRVWGPGFAARPPRQVRPAWLADEAALKAFLDRLAAAVERPASNASYDPTHDRVVLDRSGLALDRDALRRLLEAAAAGGAAEILLPVQEVPATVRAADVRAIGRQVLSSYATRVNLRDPDRVANIRLAAQRINGALLRPGDIFSFNQTVGPREPRFGFRQAKELYQGEYVLGYGGGVCQVSSTLYNTALLANLQVDVRAHHSRPLSYIEIGRDATVVYDYLDFRFTNSSPMPLLLAAGLDGDTLTVSLIGRRGAVPQRVEIVTQGLTTVPPLIREELDDALPWRSREVVSQGEAGYEVTVLRRVFEGGRLTGEQVISRDKYPARPGIVRVGLKPPDAATSYPGRPDTGTPAVDPANPAASPVPTP
ncbi:MAG: VanW family protein [Symbiobacteriia bacterium]